MQGQNKNRMPFIVAIGILLLSWITLTFDGLSSAIHLWYISEIFNHGFLIIPASIYLIYLRRGIIAEAKIETAKFPLIFIIGCIGVYAVGVAGSIDLLKHLAAFTLLPTIIWLMLGHRASFQLLFPLCFVLFSVPVGEQLVPWLQEVTADMSVFMLKSIGIPLYRSGLFIEIPQGRFLVAEACSGISFFISSIVVGCIYAYLNFTNPYKRYGFVIISIIYPIIANSIRVFGIILTGYLTNMEHAVSADHLIYGWFFFAIVLISLLAIGEWMRDKDAAWEYPIQQNQALQITLNWKIVSSAVLLMIAGVIWNQWITHSIQLANANQQSDFLIVSEKNADDSDSEFQYSPKLSNPIAQEISSVNLPEGITGQVNQARFGGERSELVSAVHRLYDEKEWSLAGQFTMPNAFGDLHLNAFEIVSPIGNKRIVAKAYLIEGEVFTNKIKAKMFETYKNLLGQPAQGIMIILSVPANEAKVDAKQALTELVKIVDSAAKTKRQRAQ